MKVVIDDVKYAPEPEIIHNGTHKSALEIRFDSDCGEDITIRDYLCSLLTTLWLEGESFSGKRPFGNSGWDYDLYAPLIRAGYLEGTLDCDGYVEEIDTAVANRYVLELITVMCYGQP